MSYFVKNCEQIVQFGSYFPLSDKLSVSSMCSQLRKEAPSGDKCPGMSKVLVK